MVGDGLVRPAFSITDHNLLRDHYYNFSRALFRITTFVVSKPPSGTQSRNKHHDIMLQSQQSVCANSEHFRQTVG